MKNPLLIPEKAFAPALVQIGRRPDEPALKDTPIVGRTFSGEMMLNAKRLEALLNAIVRRKKAATRRVPTGRF